MAIRQEFFHFSLHFTKFKHTVPTLGLQYLGNFFSSDIYKSLYLDGNMILHKMNIKNFQTKGYTNINVFVCLKRHSVSFNK